MNIFTPVHFKYKLIISVYLLLYKRFFNLASTPSINPLHTAMFLVMLPSLDLTCLDMDQQQSHTGMILSPELVLPALFYCFKYCSLLGIALLQSIIGRIIFFRVICFVILSALFISYYIYR